MTTSIDRLLAAASERAGTMFAKEGRISSFVIGLSARGDEALIEPQQPFENADILTLFYKMMLRHADATAYVHCDEAWALDTSGMAESEQKAAIEFCRQYGVRHHPKHYESVTYLVRDGEHVLLATQGIIRPSLGKPELDSLISKAFGPQDRLAGRYSDLLTLNEREEHAYKEITGVVGALMGAPI